VREFITEVEGWRARAEIPDDWLVRDYDIYSQAYWEAVARENLSPRVARLCGVLALAVAGRIVLDVPGVSASTERADLDGITARAMGFLIRVAQLLEETQQLPFGQSGPSADGTKPETA
jgi:hypothetical protein